MFVYCLFFVNFGDGNWRRAEAWIVLLAGQLRRTLLSKERYGNLLSGCGSNTQPSNWEADTLPVSYCMLLQALCFESFFIFYLSIISFQACPWGCHSYENPMWWDSTHLYFPWDSEIEWECQNVTELSYFDYTSEF